uniref:Putative glycosyl hydrolase family10 n=1 Tax=uncultured symbiotic protist of Mastotermes darwiniensis TaxID=403661 RepID=A4UX30_9EUKA|nr:putative glycosyl hydrolase family10 [uncultured symbiotic protist of Mastotermes darwiniensis]
MFAAFVIGCLGASPLAKGQSKFLGNIIPASVPANWDKYWNQATSENGCKWGTVEASKGVYNFGQCDVTANHCQTAGIPFKYHCFVWGSQEPGWASGAAGSAKQVLEGLMSAAATRYKPQLIDVVNEALHNPSSLRSGLGGSGTWGWVETSFSLAKTHFGSSTLILNDYGIINDAGAVNNMLNIVKSCPSIQAIGIQCHQFNIDSLPAATAQSNVATLAASGKPIYSSEMDASGGESAQCDTYKRIFPVLWKNTAVKGVTLWGWITGQTWKSGTGIYSNGVETCALKWLASYLSGGAGEI